MTLNKWTNLCKKLTVKSWYQKIENCLRLISKKTFFSHFRGSRAAKIALLSVKCNISFFLVPYLISNINKVCKPFLICSYLFKNIITIYPNSNSVPVQLRPGRPDAASALPHVPFILVIPLQLKAFVRGEIRQIRRPHGLFPEQ